MFGFGKSGLDPQEERLRAGVSPSDATFGIEPQDRWGRYVDGPTGQARVVESERGHWLAFYASVRNSIETGSNPPVSAREAAVTLQIIEAARRSSAEGRRIELQ